MPQFLDHFYSDMMFTISKEDKTLTRNVRLSKGYGSRKLLPEFQDKKWTKEGLEVLRSFLLKQINVTAWMKVCGNFQH